MSFLNKIFGDPNKKVIKELEPIVEKIRNLGSKYDSYSDDKLRGLAEDFKKQLKDGKTLDDILPEVFAAMRESSKRALGSGHFDVQMIGGIVLHRGHIAELKTGEGKTSYCAPLAAALNALEGKGVHVVTVNDYLSKRDCGWIGPVYHGLGLTVACIVHEGAFIFDPEYVEEHYTDERTKHLRPISRKEAYRADITYGTNNEFGFDYLRDNMVLELKQCVQRELHYAIVDEIDSILIDEARTPLIISTPAEENAEQYFQFAQIVKTLKENEDYNIDEKMRAATLTEAGIRKVEKALGVDNIYTQGGITMVHHIEQALRAETLYKRDKDYVVKDGEVIIVDEFTGRLMPGRRYSEGLHQAIEAKEGVEIKRESRTLATITFQNYFRMYKKLSGMTGTAATEAEEFHKIYGLEVVEIPTNLPVIRKDLPDRIYKDEQAKLKAIVKEVKERHEKGQPILIGTISIEKNEQLSFLLEREGIEHNLLNAKNHEKEAMVIAQAGKVGAVTVATNMAGRGVDIILGGALKDKSEYNSEQEFKEAKQEWEREHKKVLELGGLFVLGTERHESRRIDNQLRGRSGRQGDPGESVFFVCMDDDLMRIFGSERMKKIMTTLRVPDDMPIENKMISRSIEQAQKKVEGYHFDIRKHLVEYDDVMNKHREVIYKKRLEILNIFESGSSLREKVMEMVKDEITDVVNFHTSGDDESSWDLNEIYEVVYSIFPIEENKRVKLEEIRSQAGDDLQDKHAREMIVDYLLSIANKKYDEQEKGIIEAVDNPRAMHIIERDILLRTIDTLWVEHLEAMGYMRTGIGLRGYGQRDPLVEYKKEAYRLFQELLKLIRKQVVYTIFKVGIAQELAPGLMQRHGFNLQAPLKTMQKGTNPFQITEQILAQGFPLQGAKRSTVSSTISGLSTTFSEPPKKPRDATGKKIGRNDPCFCGSGKKYKRCHGV